MANSNAPTGLRPVRYLSGAVYTGAANQYAIPATDTTATFIGGLVKLAGSADANGVATVTGNVAAGDVVLGVVVGVAPITADSTIYREASVERYVMVADDPNLEFEIQEDSDGGALAATDIGDTAGIITPTAGSTVTGLSGMELDSSSAGTGVDLLMVGLARREDNAFGANAKIRVRLNKHMLVDSATGV